MKEQVRKHEITQRYYNLRSVCVKQMSFLRVNKLGLNMVSERFQSTVFNISWRILIKNTCVVSIV